VKFVKIYYEFKKIFKKYVLNIKYHLNNELLKKVCSISFLTVILQLHLISEIVRNSTHVH